MLKIVAAAAALSLTLAFTAPSTAQDAMGVDLPAACQTDAGKMAMSMPTDKAMGHTMDMDEAHAALMMGMDAMNQNMAVGASVPNLDVAFVCSMLPHHQGAIDMAKAELKYGKDDWAKAMAQKVIDAQTKEIADMVAWLATQKQ